MSQGVVGAVLDHQAHRAGLLLHERGVAVAAGRPRAGEVHQGETVERRYAPLQPELPLLLFVDGKRVCEAHPLDRLANNKRRRRALPQPEPAPLRTLKGPRGRTTVLIAAVLAGVGVDAWPAPPRGLPSCRFPGAEARELECRSTTPVRGGYYIAARLKPVTAMSHAG